MLRKLSFVTIIAVIAMLSSQVAFAQSSGLGKSQDITATANLYAKIGFTDVNPVAFGNIAVGGNPAINPTNGDLTPIGTGTGAGPGSFTITGSADATVKVTISPAQGVLSDGAGHSLKFTPEATTGGGVYTSGNNVTLTGGTAVFSVGGTLYPAGGTGPVLNTQTAGSYSTVGGTPITFAVDYVL